MVPTPARESLRARLEALRNADLGFIPMKDLLPHLREFAEEFGGPGFVSSMHPLPPTEPAEYPGVDGIFAGWDDFGAAFSTVLAEFEALLEGPGGFALEFRQRVRTRHGDVEITQAVAVALVLDEELLARVEFHIDRRAARGSVGAGAAGRSG